MNKRTLEQIIEQYDIISPEYVEITPSIIFVGYNIECQQVIWDISKDTVTIQ